MFGLNHKELEKISLESRESSEVQLNTDKFCKFASDARVAIEAARIIVKNPIVKLVLSLADTVLEALQRKLNCPAAPNGL